MSGEAEAETNINEQEDFEMILLAVMLLASILLGYRNRDRIKVWFDELLGKFTKHDSSR
jgi:hypothetical protein